MAAEVAWTELTARAKAALSGVDEHVDAQDA
jgi:hypothetical protein